MPCLIGIIGFFFPRVVIVLLYLLTGWWQGVFDGILVPILGFLFMPITLLAYGICYHYTDMWSVSSVVIMIIAVISDLGLWGNSAKARRRRG